MGGRGSRKERLRKLTGEARRLSDKGRAGRGGGVQELIQVNVVKGAKDMMGSKTLLGRVAVHISPLSEKPGVTTDDWYELGRGEWGNPEGTVRSCPSPLPSHLRTLSSPTAPPCRGVELFNLCFVRIVKHGRNKRFYAGQLVEQLERC